MRKITPHSLCYWLSCAGIGLFIGNTIKDAINYNKMLNSAPFWVFILENVVTYLLPGVVFAVLAYFLKKRQTNKVSVSESKKSRTELLKKFAEYDRSREEAYVTQYVLGEEAPLILENYGFSDYIKDVNTASDEIVFKLLDFVCDHFGHNGNINLSGKRDIVGFIRFCEQHEGKMNCRGLAMLLASLLRSVGVKARHITCMPYEDPFNDCHVVVDCLMPSGKRILLDPTYRLYLKDEAGEYVSLPRFRELLIAGEPVIANDNASYNGGAFDLEFYRNYMTKNTIRFSRGLLYMDGVDDYAVRVIVLVPTNYSVKNFTRLAQKDFVFDDRAFWRM